MSGHADDASRDETYVLPDMGTADAAVANARLVVKGERDMGISPRCALSKATSACWHRVWSPHRAFPPRAWTDREHLSATTRQRRADDKWWCWELHPAPSCVSDVEAVIDVVIDVDVDADVDVDVDAVGRAAFDPVFDPAAALVRTNDSSFGTRSDCCGR